MNHVQNKLGNTAKYNEMAAFLGLDEDDSIRRTFDAELTPENGHLGRWRVELEPEQRDRLDRRYHEVIAAMTTDPNQILLLPRGPVALQTTAPGLSGPTTASPPACWPASANAPARPRSARPSN
ncbi:MAG: hypothetical protein HC794_07675 [Nitrospiraceae bacterium]|nr:hypothetical protein [Nitrospiraceae bacterium]